jgi:hypothetical protein
MGCLSRIEPLCLNFRLNGGAEIAAAYHVDMTAAAMMGLVFVSIMRGFLAESVLRKLGIGAYQCIVVTSMHRIRRGTHGRNNESDRHHHDDQCTHVPYDPGQIHIMNSAAFRDKRVNYYKVNPYNLSSHCRVKPYIDGGFARTSCPPCSSCRHPS